MPIIVSHGEGRAAFGADADLSTLQAEQQVVLGYTDCNGKPIERYPNNPNGSPEGANGFCNRDGRITIMMPHPERCYRTMQMSWSPEHEGMLLASAPEKPLFDRLTDRSPWARMFENARVWLG